jgi:hypothetical protein
MRSILSTTPLDLINLFLDFERFQVVKLRFMGLKLGVKFVFTRFFLRRVRDSVATTWGLSRAEQGSTVSFRSNRTTRPPLSPVAR